MMSMRQDQNMDQMAMEVSAEIHFAQKLASNEKKNRDRALKRLQKYLNIRSTQGDGLSDDDLIKIWKGIHYCMWMQDKPLIQEELSQRVANLFHSFPQLGDSLRFANVFFITEAREWHLIDRLRIDKFMMLIRDILHETFLLMSQASWPLSACQAFSESLASSVLDEDNQKLPDGLKLHLADIFMPELRKVSLDGMTNQKLTLLMFPFASFILKTRKRNLASKVVSQTITQVLQEFGSWSKKGTEIEDKKEEKYDMEEKDNSGEEEEEESDDGDEEMELEVQEELVEKSEKRKRMKFDMGMLIRLMFKMAEHKKVPAKNRAMVYKIVQRYSTRDPTILSTECNDDQEKVVCEENAIYIQRILKHFLKSGEEKTKRKRKRKKKPKDSMESLDPGVKRAKVDVEDNKHKAVHGDKNNEKSQGDDVHVRKKLEAKGTSSDNSTELVKKAGKKRPRLSDPQSPSEGSQPAKKAKKETTVADPANEGNNSHKDSLEITVGASPHSPKKTKKDKPLAILAEKNSNDATNNKKSFGTSLHNKKSLVAEETSSEISKKKKKKKLSAILGDQNANASSQLEIEGGHLSVYSSYSILKNPEGLRNAPLPNVPSRVAKSPSTQDVDSTDSPPANVGDIGGSGSMSIDSMSGSSMSDVKVYMPDTLPLKACGENARETPKKGKKEGKKKKKKQGAKSLDDSSDQGKSEEGEIEGSNDEAKSTSKLGLLGAITPTNLIKKAVAMVMPASDPGPTTKAKAADRNGEGSMTPGAKKRVVFDLRKNKANKFKDYLKGLSSGSSSPIFEPSKSPSQSILKSSSLSSSSISLASYSESSTPLAKKKKTDEVYDALKSHFLMKGKGRRPQLPEIDVATNKILGQLHFLREEGNVSWDIVTEWFWKIFPSQRPTMGQLEGRISKAVSHLHGSINRDVLQDFLCKEVDFNEIPKALSDIGLSRKILMGDMNFVIPQGLVVTNSMAADLEQFRSKERLPAIFTHKWLKTILYTSGCEISDSAVRTKTDKLFKTLKSLKKKSCSDKVEELLRNRFITDTSDSPLIKLSVCKQCEEFRIANAKLRNEIEKYTSVNKKMSDIASVHKEENFELKATCREQMQQLNSLKSMKSEMEQVKKDYVLVKEECLSLKKSRAYRMNKLLRRQIKSLKKNVEDLKLRLDDKQETCNSLSQEVEILKNKLRSERSMKSRNKKTLSREQDNTLRLSQVLNTEKEEEDIKFRNEGRGQRYCDNIRYAYMALQGDTNVSAENCSKVIQIVGHYIFDKDINKDDLPKPSSALNFQDEAHVITKRQAVEEIKSSGHIIYASDGTSRDKRQYIEQHVILDCGRFISLGFTEVATEDSQTLLEELLSKYTELCELYSDVYNTEEEKNSLLKDLIRKTKGLLSDRASVMKAFDQKFADYKETFLEGEDCSTHFLFCNAHFLLGLSSSAEAAMKKLEEKIQERLGRDSRAEFFRFQTSSETACLRLIRTAAEVLGPRCDEKSGTRRNWLGFCSSKGITSTFTSFRSNRFNNIFQNASALIRHRSHIEEFLTDCFDGLNLKLQSIVADLKDDRIICMIAALSLFHIYFTEPYWALMNSKKTYADFPGYVRKMESKLCEWKDDDFDLRMLDHVFEDFVSTSQTFVSLDIAQFLDNFEHSMQVRSNLQFLSTSCFLVFERQLSDFLDSGIFGGEIAADVFEVLKTCPLTNLTGERLFGRLDYDIHRRRNTSLHLRSTNTMWKTNRTSFWLRKQNALKKKKIIAMAIKRGPVWRKKSRESEKKVMDCVKQKLVENKERRLEKSVKQHELKSAIMDKVISQGGVSTTKEDVDKLIKEPNALENIKAQINYRRLCLNEKIQVSGNLNTLYCRLVEHLGYNLTEEDRALPPKKKRKLKN